jgi:hypothetical protein
MPARPLSARDDLRNVAIVAPNRFGADSWELAGLQEHRQGEVAPCWDTFSSIMTYIFNAQFILVPRCSRFRRRPGIRWRRCTRRWPHGGEWLLAFDNAPRPDGEEALVPPAEDGRVLITSRNALWPPGQALKVPVLDLEPPPGVLAARTADVDRQAAGLA